MRRPKVKIHITNSIALDEDEIEVKFVRSSGPGGQNVNKVATAVQLRFDMGKSINLPDYVKQKLLRSGDQRITKEGVVVIFAESHRTQQANRKEAIARLSELIEKASYVPKKRLATRPSLASRKKRMDRKKKRGATKKLRSGKIDIS